MSFIMSMVFVDLLVAGIYAGIYVVMLPHIRDPRSSKNPYRMYYHNRDVECLFIVVMNIAIWLLFLITQFWVSLAMITFLTIVDIAGFIYAGIYYRKNPETLHYPDENPLLNFGKASEPDEEKS